MKKMIMLAAALVFFAAEAQAVTVTYTNTSGNAALNAAFDNLVTNLQNSSGFGQLGHQNDFAKGMFESAAFTSNAASFSGYQNYSLFALMGGMSVAAVTKDGSVNDVSSKLAKDGDVYAGASATAAVNLGVNLSIISKLIGLSDNSIYANVKFGGTPEIQQGDYYYKGFLFGAGLSVQLIDSVDFLVGSWRGFAVNSGFYMNQQKSKVKVKFNSVSGTSGGNTLTIDPDVYLKSDAKIYTIPFELTTALSFFVFNVTAGGGADIALGKGDIDVDVISGVKNGSTKVGTISVSDAGVSGVAPRRFNPKLMAGLGFQMSLVKVDVLGYYYPVQKGANVNLSAGVVF